MKKFLFLITVVFAFAITPFQKITYNGYISKIAYNKTYLIAGLENGNIIIKNFKTLKTLEKIKLPKIHDFMGDLISMPIYSLDISPDNSKLMILAEGENSKREMFIYNFKTHNLKHIFSVKETLMKGRFINNDLIFFGLLSDEAILYNLKNNQNIYRVQVGNYVFSTYKLNKNKTFALFGDESGALKLIDVKTGKKLKKLKGFNKDKTISCDMKKNLALNASSDMRVAIYDINSGYEKNTLKLKFLPYAAAISPDLSMFAVQYNEKNDIALYTMYNKKIDTLSGHTMALNGIDFLNSNTIISFSPAEILIWKLSM